VKKTGPRSLTILVVDVGSTHVNLLVTSRKEIHHDPVRSHYDLQSV